MEPEVEPDWLYDPAYEAEQAKIEASEPGYRDLIKAETENPDLTFELQDGIVICTTCPN